MNDRRIVDLIVDGACSTDEIGDRCGAGTGCGGCLLMIERLLARHAPSVVTDALVA